MDKGTMTNGRNKGKAYENEVARMWREAGWGDAKRHLEFQSAEAEEGRDVDGTQPFAVQVKCWKSTPSISAIEQAQETDDYPIRVAILKRTRSKGTTGLEVAAVDADVFFIMLRLLKKYNLIGEILDELLRQ